MDKYPVNIGLLAHVNASRGAPHNLSPKMV